MSISSLKVKCRSENWLNLRLAGGAGLGMYLLCTYNFLLARSGCTPYSDPTCLRIWRHFGLQIAFRLLLLGAISGDGGVRYLQVDCDANLVRTGWFGHRIDIGEILIDPYVLDMIPAATIFSNYASMSGTKWNGCRRRDWNTGFTVLSIWSSAFTPLIKPTLFVKSVGYESTSCLAKLSCVMTVRIIRQAQIRVWEELLSSFVGMAALCDLLL